MRWEKGLRLGWVCLFFYLVLSVDSPSSDLWVQHAAQDIQSVFCSSGYPSGSSQCPTHDTYFKSNESTKETKRVFITKRCHAKIKSHHYCWTSYTGNCSSLFLLSPEAQWLLTLIKGLIEIWVMAWQKNEILLSACLVEWKLTLVESRRHLSSTAFLPLL